MSCSAGERMVLVTDIMGTDVFSCGQFLMPYPILCNDVKRDGAKTCPDLISGLFSYVPLHKIGYGIQFFPFLENHWFKNQPIIPPMGRYIIVSFSPGVAFW